MDQEIKLDSKCNLSLIQEILAAAVAGGIGYWASPLYYRWTIKEIDVVRLKLMVNNDETPLYGKVYEIRASDIEQVLNKFKETEIEGLAKKYQESVNKAVMEHDAGEIDSDMADWVIQVVCFGKIIFG